ncbi:hypothetical protein ACFXPX_20400 [Kitasatospora sp. NPDC059146]|uniref:hypothetical protein n=1 Tax=unclassified Kitasatospora TaxID=2633591 RepID=UPI0036B01FF6
MSSSTTTPPPVVDVHVIARTPDGKILLSQRGDPYGYGRWHAPSSKLNLGGLAHHNWPAA